MSFWKELSRRNVVRVGIAYAVAAWLIIHPVDIIFPILHLPDWSITLVTALLVIGFPFALIFAWAFEVTPEGLKRTKDVPLTKSITKLTGEKLNYILAGLLVIAVAYILFNKYYLEPRVIESKQASVVSNAVKTQKTIAVLPFVDLSPKSDQGYFVDGLSEEILNSLSQIPGLNVTGRTSSFSFKGSNKTVQEIASILGADHIIEGSVRKAGNALRITVQLLRATDGVHLWSKIYDRELKDIFAVQEDIATVVASELKATLGIEKSLKQLGGTNNEEAYELYLISQGQLSNGEYKLALESINKSLSLDPHFALAWAQKASVHIHIGRFVSATDVAAEDKACLNAALKTIELEPNLARGYQELASIKFLTGNFIDAQLALKKELELLTRPLTGNELGIPIIYGELGYFKKAIELLEEMRQNDPLNRSICRAIIRTYCFLGDIQRAEKEYERGKALAGDKWDLGDDAITNARLLTGNVRSRDAIVYSSPIYDVAKEHLDSPVQALTQLRRIDNDGDNLSIDNLEQLSCLAAYFGDSEFAMDVIEKANGSEAGLVQIWAPVMHDVRQLPRFKKFVREVGLVNCWNQFGWPDMCHKLDNGDFECD
jgi:adenylate cyclase